MRCPGCGRRVKGDQRGRRRAAKSSRLKDRRMAFCVECRERLERSFASVWIDELRAAGRIAR